MQRMELKSAYHGPHAKNPLCRATVWYADAAGCWAQLSSMYASRSGQKCWLVTRDVRNTVEDIIGRYCPQCCTRYTNDDAMTYKNRCNSCFQCPYCSSPLTVIGLSETECAFQCGYCLWRSDVAGTSCVIASDRRDLETLVLTLEREAAAIRDDTFAAILEKYTTSSNVDSSRVPRSCMLNRRWGLTELDERLIQCPHSQGHQVDEAVSVHKSADNHFDSLELPQRVSLLSKRTLRSKLDMQQGRMKILVQPKPNPLDGDTSQKNRGAWWVKDSSAVHELPRISVLSYPSLEELLVDDSNPEVVLMIQNPKDVEVSFRINANKMASVNDFEPTEDFLRPKSVLTLECSSAEDKGPVLILGAYEDEFLREEINSETISSRNIPGDGSHWRIEYCHNTAKVWIPVSVVSVHGTLRQKFNVSAGRLNSDSSDLRNTVTTCFLHLTAHVGKHDPPCGVVETKNNDELASDNVTMPILVSCPVYW